MNKPKHLWVVLYSGYATSFPTLDFRAVWETREAAREALKREKGNSRDYSIVKYVRAK